MSDYLSEVTARSLGTAEVVQPRLASRFEPAMHGGSLDAALPPWNAADRPDGLAEFHAETFAASGTYEQAAAPVEVPKRPSKAARPARQISGEPESQPSHPQRNPFAQMVSPEIIGTPANQPLTKPGRSVPVRPTEGHPEDTRRPAQHADTAAASVQPPDKVSSPVSQSDLPAQMAARPPSRQEADGLDERIRAAVDDALASQRTRRDDGSREVDRNRAQSVVGLLSSQGARDLDDRIRSAIDGASARQRNGSGAENSASATRQRSARVEAIENRAAAGRTTPSREESTPDVQPAVLARVIAQPQVAVASPVMPVSSAKNVAGNQDAGREPQPPPTIQVTIGRIEVRATPAPTAGATGKSRQTPAISLDDYLRQRNRGGQ